MYRAVLAAAEEHKNLKPRHVLVADRYLPSVALEAQGCRPGVFPNRGGSLFLVRSVSGQTSFAVDVVQRAEIELRSRLPDLVGPHEGGRGHANVPHDSHGKVRHALARDWLICTSRGTRPGWWSSAALGRRAARGRGCTNRGGTGSEALVVCGGLRALVTARCASRFARRSRTPACRGSSRRGRTSSCTLPALPARVRVRG